MSALLIQREQNVCPQVDRIMGALKISPQIGHLSDPSILAMPLEVDVDKPVEFDPEAELWPFVS